MSREYDKKKICSLGPVILFLLFLCHDAYAAGQIFGILGKSKDDINFILTAKGCHEVAQLQGDSCELLGASGPASARTQAMAMKQAALSNKYSAFALSVVMSNVLAREVERYVTVPVITFDSPFLAEDAYINRAYVGPDNVSFGRDLARLAKQHSPKGGTVFIMGDLHDPNLAERILGIRRELANDSTIGLNQKLHGQGNWIEKPRSPWNAGDDSNESLLKLDVILNKIKPDIFISVGHWPILNEAAYRKTVSRHRVAGQTVHTAIFIGVGEINDTTLQLMKDGLVDGFVKIDFPEIGKACYQVMRDILDGKNIKRYNYIPSRPLQNFSDTP